MSSGVPGLDAVLGAGLARGGVYLVEGPAGAGKTILASQIGFGQIARGGSVVCVTLVAESHGKWLGQLRGFGFFDEAAFPDRFLLVSGQGTVLGGGPDALLDLLGRLLSQRRPSVLILEGFQTLGDLGVGTAALVRFVHHLNALVSLADCVTLLLSMTDQTGTRAEHAIVDGLLRMSVHAHDARRVKYLEAVKLRGCAHLDGEHAFVLTPQGMRVYPRIEARGTRHPQAPEHFDAGLAFGVAGLDAMLESGLRAGTSTMLLGAPGTGKTLLGLQFLAQGARQGEPCLFYGLFESPARLLAKARRIGIDLDGMVADGRLQIAWQVPLERLLDELADDLLSRVRRQGSRRVVIDGVDGLSVAAVRPERLTRLLTALVAELRTRGTTVLLSEELPVFSHDIVSPHVQASSVVENVLLLRYVEMGMRLRRLISVLKTYDSGYDPTIRELLISDGGLEVGQAFAGIESAMTGDARLVRDRLVVPPAGRGT